MSDLSTPRLWLRQWRASDLEPFAALNADPQVMEFMPGSLSCAESDALARRAEAEIARQGWGFWATELCESGAFFAFESLVLEEVVSFTVPPNRRSRAVMERLGMRHDAAGDFDHPRLPPGHPLCRHVLYRLRREDWQYAGRAHL